MRDGALGRALTRPETMDRVAVQVRQAREAKGLTQWRLAELVGVDHSMVNRIESGQRMPSMDLANRLADVLGLSLDRMFGRAA